MVVAFYKRHDGNVSLLIYNGYYNHIITKDNTIPKVYNHTFITKTEFINELGVESMDEVSSGSLEEGYHNNYCFYKEEDYTQVMVEYLVELKKICRSRKLKDLLDKK